MIPIPEDAECYSEESTRTSGYGDSQECLDQPGMLAGSGGCSIAQNQQGDEGADALGMSVDGTQTHEGLCDLAGPGLHDIVH